MEQWYVMRIIGNKSDIKIKAALDALNMRYFQPMHEVVRKVGGKTEKVSRPIVGGLFFIYGEEADVKEQCDISGNRLQFVFARGKRITDRMIVSEKEMNAFIQAVNNVEEHSYLTIEEAYKAVGKRVRIHGGPLDGQEGKLLSDRRKKKTFIIQLTGVMALAVTIVPEVVEVLE